MQLTYEQKIWLMTALDMYATECETLAQEQDPDHFNERATFARNLMFALIRLDTVLVVEGRK